MNRQNFLCLIIMLGFKKNNENIYTRKGDTVSFYNNYIVITKINHIVTFHSTYCNALKKVTNYE